MRDARRQSITGGKNPEQQITVRLSVHINSEGRLEKDVTKTFLVCHFDVVTSNEALVFCFLSPLSPTARLCRMR